MHWRENKQLRDLVDYDETECSTDGRLYILVNESGAVVSGRRMLTILLDAPGNREQFSELWAMITAPYGLLVTDKLWNALGI